MARQYLLMACVERYDGNTYEQLITYLTEEQRHNTELINKLTERFEKTLGKDYYVVHTWVE